MRSRSFACFARRACPPCSRALRGSLALGLLVITEQRGKPGDARVVRMVGSHEFPVLGLPVARCTQIEEGPGLRQRVGALRSRQPAERTADP